MPYRSSHNGEDMRMSAIPIGAFSLYEMPQILADNVKRSLIAHSVVAAVAVLPC